MLPEADEAAQSKVSDLFRGLGGSWVGPGNSGTPVSFTKIPEPVLHLDRIVAYAPIRRRRRVLPRNHRAAWLRLRQIARRK